jgi:hypothetical protein
VERVDQIVGGHWSTTSAPTATHKHNYDVAAAQFSPVLVSLQKLIDEDLVGIERAAESAGAPRTPGRVPHWSPE